MKMNLSLLFHDAKVLADPSDDNMSMASLKTNTSNATQAAAKVPIDTIDVDMEDGTEGSSITDPFRSGNASPKASSQRAGVSDSNG